MMNTIDRTYFEVIKTLHDGLYITDRDRVITYWNPAAEKISGYSAEEVVGKSCADSILTHIDHNGTCLCTGDCPLAQSIKDGLPHEGDVFMRHKEGHRIPVSVRISSLKDENGKIIGAVELFSDISNQEANSLRLKELEQLAFLDNLTKLANRNYIHRELKSCFEEVSRYNLPFGLLFMDIDHFKKFNDTYGHDIGDQVLKYVSATFTNNARSFDLYGRWGGEEFIAIIRNVNDNDLENLGNRMRELIAGSYIMHNQKQLHVTISIGATLVRKGDTTQSLINRADELLYQSKSNGRNRLTRG